MKQIICIDLLEDNDDDALVIKVKSQKLRYDFHWEIFKDASSAEAHYKHLLTELGPSNPLPSNRLILLDLALQQSHGFEFLSFIKKGDPRLATLPIIIVTASDSKEDVRNTFKGGGTAFLKKPFALEEFTRTLETLIMTGRLKPLCDADEKTDALKR
ncbi:MAG: response regulator [Candidatus Omnitrophica bacterium]|nr:response regulator [Candidatus Omnitrophota bacterium]